MGGSEAEVHDDTTEILLEAAYFQPDGDLAVVEAARAALRVERALRARRRSERRAHGLGPRGRAARSRSPAATVAPEPIDEYPVPVTPARIHGARPRGSEALLGVELGAERVKDALRPLEIEVEEVDGR